jgi:uncharacterized protein YecE (DUF72 family)
MKIHTGVNLFPLHRRKVLSNCDIGEVSSFFETRPKKNTLSRWRSEAPKNFRFIIPAPWALTDPNWKKAGATSWQEGSQGFLESEQTEKIWKHLDRACGVLRSQTILFVTPPSFRPSLKNKNSMVDFFSEIKRKNFRFAWEPRGLWTSEEALEISKELNLTLVSDPLSPEFINSEEDFRYFRIFNLKHANNLNEMGFEEIYEQCRGSKRSFVIFATPNPIKDSQRFKRFLNTV